MTSFLVLAPLLRPDPDPARAWVRAELSKPEYQQPLLKRIIGWFGELLDKLLNAAGGIGHLGTSAAFALLVVLLLVIVVVLARLRPDASRRTTPGAVFADQRIGAAEHRALADRALADQRWDDALVEAMRAIAAGLVERDLVDDLPGATAHEVADAAARLFTEYADRVRAAADVFDAVLYGDRRADREDAAALLDLETTLRGARPSAEAAGAVMAVPR